jgi:lysozyme
MIHMVPGPWLFEFLKGFEKFRPTAYNATKAEAAKGIWTIGYGHTKGVKAGQTCTVAMAIEWLEDDVAQAAIDVCRAVNVPLNQQQFDALVSLVFNCGYGKKDGVKGDIADSTLLQRLNAGDYAGAAAQFTSWDHQGGIELDGLRKRRQQERDHFLGKDLVA